MLIENSRVKSLYKFLFNGNSIEIDGQTIAMSEDEQIGFIMENTTTKEIILLGCHYPTIHELNELANKIDVDTWLNITYSNCDNK
jgi:hypothetical protein